MEIYILDDLLRRVVVIDRFVSAIWTERWQDKGDFELVVASTPEMRNMLRTGKRLACNESDRVMEIEYVDDSVDSDGAQTLKVTGSSLERLLQDRVATDGLIGLSEERKWLITATPGNVARHIFQKICVEGILSSGDIIPFMKPGRIHEPDYIPEYNQTIVAEIPLSSVYDAIREMCVRFELGFRLVRNFDKSELYFNVYAGNNRTGQQKNYPPVIFSPELENMKNTKEIRSTVDFKNVAYVFSKNGAEIVYAENYGADLSGFERRILFVDANDIDLEAGPELNAALIAKGQEALNEHRSLAAFDGEVDQFGAFKYNRDYFLGDLVEMRNTDGATNTMRVTEQIFASDAEGDRSYPTLTINSIVLPGTWDSWGMDTWDNGGEDVWDEEDD